MITNIMQAMAEVDTGKPACKCISFWLQFKGSPDFATYNGRYGNHHGKPGSPGAERNDLESEYQQGKFNDVNEIGTSKSKKQLQAVSPKGWQGTVQKMQDHPEISNPYALAYWMKDQGYHPHDTKHRQSSK